MEVVEVTLSMNEKSAKVDFLKLYFESFTKSLSREEKDFVEAEVEEIFFMVEKI